MRALPPALAALALLAGCLGAPSETSDVEHAFAGAFAASATAEEVETLGARVRAEGGAFVALASIPVEFSASALTSDACRVVREFAATQPSITRLGACEPAALRAPAEGVAPAAQESVIASMPVGQAW